MTLLSTLYLLSPLVLFVLMVLFAPGPESQLKPVRIVARSQRRR
jgi:hypothetical protein